MFSKSIVDFFHIFIRLEIIRILSESHFLLRMYLYTLLECIFIQILVIPVYKSY